MTDEKLSTKDQEDLDSLNMEDFEQQMSKRSILEIWYELFKSVDSALEQEIPAVVAQRAVSTWPKLTYQDTARYWVLYHQHLDHIGGILRDALTEHPNATSNVEDDDFKENREIYLDLLVRWNLFLEELEEDWVAVDPESHIQIAAMIDVKAFVFSDTGLIGHLNARQFPLTNDEFLAHYEAVKEEA